MTRRIGVLTYHRSFNYGSYWQARCLVEGLRAMGHDAELLDHADRDVEWREARCLLQPTLPEPTRRQDFAAYKRKGRRLIEAMDRLPLSPRFPLHAPDQAPAYDAVVVGSDEVWNFRHPWYGGTPLFFGDGLRADRLVAYAASIGNHDASDGMREDYAERLTRFAAISVRDDNSRALVQAGLGIDPPLVLDPVLQFPPVIAQGEEAEPYVLIYGHGFPDWLSAALRHRRGAGGMRMVSVGYRNDCADEQRIDAGPIEFAELVAGASAVVTNFFHGCVFALLNNKPLVTAPSAYRFNKVRDLAAKLGAQRHIVGEDASATMLTERLATPPDPAITARIAELRASSTEFLRAALA
ncbi:polysaccharide pyruvyl transferase family protein [Sphingomonas jatrophae]|uniref:Polysaccharide pyruvyl transferase n=1 Tax=Sphingomonas jatrophae TaxID=1166337 RepID=A0A1I6JFH7_9SPHN|nr:polysaccharide pyruvyl transferase family protein [Sphingomonas jatrophae]SFR77738.1 Polysaccharide pyruvyl transferase [Sphingomonas jatrophae]